MNDTTVDDRRLVEQILDDGSQSALTELIERHKPRLLRRAAAKLHQWPALTAHGAADDLVQEFLVEKVLPPRKQQVMLRVIAMTGRPLWPRLCTSFENFLKDLLRRTPILSRRLTFDVPDEAASRMERSREIWGEIIGRTTARLIAIRQLVGTPQKTVPYGAILLLSERMLLAQQIAAAFAPEGEPGRGGQNVREMTESVAQWTMAEEGCALPPRRIQLGEAWRRVCDVWESRPRLADSETIAEAVGISRTNWLQSVKRGREMIASLLGAVAAAALFSHWPETVFQRAEQSSAKGAP